VTQVFIAKGRRIFPCGSTHHLELCEPLNDHVSTCQRNMSTQWHLGVCVWLVSCCWQGWEGGGWLLRVAVWKVLHAVGLLAAAADDFAKFLLPCLL
jgi:hypothetical protein